VSFAADDDAQRRVILRVLGVDAFIWLRISEVVPL
jgi:hypothetical protein